MGSLSAIAIAPAMSIYLSVLSEKDFVRVQDFVLNVSISKSLHKKLVVLRFLYSLFTAGYWLLFLFNTFMKICPLYNSILIQGIFDPIKTIF